jgi:alpha-1,2-mannosyltransferase
VAGLWAVLFFTVLKNQMVDFEVNYKAGFRLSEGETLYPGPLLEGHYEFKYPPFAALVYLPLALLPLTAAKGIWSLLVLAASGACLWLSIRLSDAKEHPPHPALALLPGLVLVRFFLRELQLGQVNAVVMLLLLTMTSVLFVKEGQKASKHGELLGGLLWALAVAVKPYSFIFFPYFLIKKRWNVLLVGLAALGAAFLIPAFFYGFRGNMTVHHEWVSTLSRSTPHLLTSQDNISLLALLAKWRFIGPSPLAAWVVAAGLLGLVMLAIMLQGRGLAQPEFLECSALLFIIPLLSPLGWDYTFLFSLPALTLCFRHSINLRWGGRITFYTNACLIFFMLYDLLGRKAYACLMGLSLPTLFFSVILGFLVHVRWKRLA